MKFNFDFAASVARDFRAGCVSSKLITSKIKLLAVGVAVIALLVTSSSREELTSDSFRSSRIRNWTDVLCNRAKQAA